jgi:hypothetical protein
VDTVNDSNVTLSWSEPRNNANLIARYLLDVFGEFRAADGSILRYHPDSIDPVVGDSRPIPIPLYGFPLMAFPIRVLMAVLLT